MEATRLVVLVLVLTLLITLGGAAGAQEPQMLGSVGCVAGDSYDPDCDVDHSGRIDVVDIQLVAQHWHRTGTWTGEAWVPKTGQTISYALGDDGDLEKGVAWPSPRFTDNGNGTATDNLTGLIWLKDAACMGQRQWSDSLTQIGALNAGRDFYCDDYWSGTFDDWRLPNVRELFSLADFSSAAGLPSGHPFTGVQSDFYWSSTTTVGYPDIAWIVTVSGYVWPEVLGGKAKYWHVWPVRCGCCTACGGK